jgi:F0F1-type ATP synthase membrane subunit c/vacuolar-type H+-ATPase subunit K
LEKTEKGEKQMVSRLRKPLLALGIAVYLSCLVVSPAVAGMVGAIASQGASSEARQSEISRIQTALETQIVTEKLKACGLTPGEIEQKLQGLSDEQIHMLAQASDRVLAGGDALGVVIAILVIVLLVVLILKLSDKTVVVK